MKHCWTCWSDQCPVTSQNGGPWCFVLGSPVSFCSYNLLLPRLPRGDSTLTVLLPHLFLNILIFPFSHSLTLSSPPRGSCPFRELIFCLLDIATVEILSQTGAVTQGEGCKSGSSWPGIPRIRHWPLPWPKMWKAWAHFPLHCAEIISPESRGHELFPSEEHFQSDLPSEIVCLAKIPI